MALHDSTRPEMLRTVMNDEDARTLVHKVNNLLAVVFTQSDVARAAGDAGELRRAIELIEKAARDTEAVVRTVTATLRRES